MATRMKLKLKTVFVLYFMVSLMGLIYALMQLGKCVCVCQNLVVLQSHSPVVHFQLTDSNFSPPTKLIILDPSFVHCVPGVQVNVVTAQSMTCPRTVPYRACGGSYTVFRSRSGNPRPPNNHRSSRPRHPCPPSSSSPRHTQGR